MEMIINTYPVERPGFNYDFQGNIDAFANSDATVMTIVVPKNARAKVKARWKSAIERSRRNYVVETVDVGVQVRRR